MDWLTDPANKEIKKKLRTINKPEGKLNMEYFHLEPHQFKMDDKLYQINASITAMCSYVLIEKGEEPHFYSPSHERKSPRMKNYVEDTIIGPIYDDPKPWISVTNIWGRAEYEWKRNKAKIDRGRIFEVNEKNKRQPEGKFENIDDVSAVMKSVLAEYFNGNFVWGATTFEVTASRRIRLPKTIRLRVKNLIYNAKRDSCPKNFARSMQSIKSILDPESFPLESITLRLHDKFSFDNYEHVLCDPMIRTAKELVLSCALTIENVRIMRSMDVQVTRYQFLEGSFMDIIRRWIRTGFEMREGYTFRGFLEGEVSKIFRELKEMEVAEIGELPETRLTRFPECFILPIAAKNFSRLLQIYCLEDSEHEDAFDINVNVLLNDEIDDYH